MSVAGLLCVAALRGWAGIGNLSLGKGTNSNNVGIHIAHNSCEPTQISPGTRLLAPNL